MNMNIDIMFSIYRYNGRVISIIAITEIYDEVAHHFSLRDDEREELLKWAGEFQKTKAYKKLGESYQQVVDDLRSWNEPTISGEARHLPDFGNLIHTTETKNVRVENL